MTFRRTAWHAGALMALGLLIGGARLVRAAGCGQDDCGNSGLEKSTYSTFGIDIFRHEAQVWGCENDHVVTQQGLVRNAIVAIGVGHVYGSDTWESWGPVNVQRTWNKIDGCATFHACAPPFGWPCIDVSKCHEFEFDWFVASDHVLYYYLYDRTL